MRVCRLGRAQRQVRLLRAEQVEPEPLREVVRAASLRCTAVLRVASLCCLALRWREHRSLRGHAVRLAARTLGGFGVLVNPEPSCFLWGGRLAARTQTPGGRGVYQVLSIDRAM
eukprot:354145-Chlamydomonas_euryale.AAC.2